MINSCSHCCTKIKDISVTIENKIILNKISLHINCKEIVAVIGPNGAGKSTLLKVFLNHIPYQGEINYQVKGIRNTKPRIGYVPQKLNFPEDSPITVLEFIALGTMLKPIYFGVNKRNADKIKNNLALAEADHLINRKVNTLSGGELQRVLLSMAMNPVPDLLLLDEPSNAIDMKGLALFYKIVDELRKNYDVSIVLVTHDLMGVANFANRMILLNQEIIAEGTPKEVFKDKNLLKAFGPSLWNTAKYPEFKI